MGWWEWRKAGETGTGAGVPRPYTVCAGDKARSADGGMCCSRDRVKKCESISPSCDWAVITPRSLHCAGRAQELSAGKSGLLRSG